MSYRLMLLDHARGDSLDAEEPECLDYMQLRNQDALREWHMRLAQHEARTAVVTHRAFWSYAGSDAHPA
jgi:predicted thioredoxin/glutaredoxin